MSYGFVWRQSTEYPIFVTVVIKARMASRDSGNLRGEKMVGWPFGKPEGRMMLDVIP